MVKPFNGMSQWAHFRYNNEGECRREGPTPSGHGRGRPQGKEVVNLHAMVMKKTIRQAESQPLVGRKEKWKTGTFALWGSKHIGDRSQEAMQRAEQPETTKNQTAFFRRGTGE